VASKNTGSGKLLEEKIEDKVRLNKQGSNSVLLMYQVITISLNTAEVSHFSGLWISVRHTVFHITVSRKYLLFHGSFFSVVAYAFV